VLIFNFHYALERIDKVKEEYKECFYFQMNSTNKRASTLSFFFEEKGKG